MSLDQSRLENVHPSGGKVLARCPACAEQGGDKTGDHLFQSADGGFGCIRFPGDAGKDHRARIFALVGVKDLAPATPNAAPFKSCVPPTKSAKNDSVWGPWKYVETYDYVNAKGALLFHVDRNERFDQYGNKKKKFPCRRPGQSINAKDANIDGVERVLYRLPQVLAQVERGGDVFAAEGEKDVAALESLGLCATCNPGGAGKWLPSFSETLRGAGVFIVADKDDPGRNHAAKVQAALQCVADSVRVLELPDRPGHKVKDAADWVAAGGTADELAELMRAADDEADDTKPEAANAAEWINAVLPPVDPIICELFDRGDKVPVIGSSKARKTFCVLQLSMSLAAGREKFLCWRIPQPRRVLVLQMEIKEAHYMRRVQNMAKALGITAAELGDRLRVASLRGKSVNEATIMQHALRYAPDVIVIDPLYKLTTGDENSAEDMKPTLALFDRLAEATGAAIMYVHHNAKGTAGDRDARDRGAGSGVIARDFDAAFYLTEHRDTGDGGAELTVVETLLRNYPPQAPFTVQWTEGAFAVADGVEAVVRTSRNKNKPESRHGAKIVALANKHPDMSRREIAERLGCSVGTVQAWYPKAKD